MAKSYLSESEIRNIVSDFCQTKNLPQNQVRGYSYHLKRFVKTRDYLIAIPSFKGNILEIGGYDVISEVIRKDFPDNIYTNTNFELRDLFPIKDNEYDFILNLEVIEHISEKDCPWKQAFFTSGIEHLLRECYRILKPGGYMLLTTPNSISYTLMQKIFEQSPPWLYFLHYKEYTLEQIQDILLQSGFKIEYIKTDFVFSTLERHKYIEEFLQKNNYSIENRGDIIVALVKKEGV